MQFGHHIREYRGEILDFLAKMIAIPSIADLNKAEPGLPYGADAAAALQCILEKANEMGFFVKNVGNYAGHAEYSCGTEGRAAVLAHVDVVPAGSGWHTDPFVMTEQNGLLYGRGVLDDKGSAVVALFCLKALKDRGVTGKRSLRCVFGSGEEIGMTDLPHYFAQEPYPDFAFTPDSDYGICNREKGILRFMLRGSNDSSILLSLEGGQVPNAVPDFAKATVRATAIEADQLQVVSEKEPCDVVFHPETQTVTLTVTGKAAHAREPELGVNAAAHLVRILETVFGKEKLGTLLQFYQSCIELELDGKSLGIAYHDDPSGALTLNTGIMKIQEQGEIVLDIRYPVTDQGSRIIEIVRRKAAPYGITLIEQEDLKPLYAKEDSKLVQLLRDAYRAVTGEEALLYATGGGTYARCIPEQCVAFGPLFPGEPDRKMHQADEHVELERFFLHAEICLEAMYRLITEA